MFTRRRLSHLFAGNSMDTQLSKAAESGRSGDMLELLDEGADVNYVDLVCFAVCSHDLDEVVTRLCVNRSWTESADNHYDFVRSTFGLLLFNF